ncbi:hypothetical protein SAMN03080606_02951 [Alkaliphilus peptidifermentans DSM 18978]|uniref:Uncharacterized protein n=1 Tax=Alkaliphilus peptidifermentans DSM 18978 TaxID=1120976 RepID=A0A1G5JN41_9FIRM|nr:hypothetical protein SAMN03080606_02951 [Alkaliphilus peptidifermentans DSM 18978]
MFLMVAHGQRYKIMRLCNSENPLLQKKMHNSCWRGVAMYFLSINMRLDKDM